MGVYAEGSFMRISPGASSDAISPDVSISSGVSTSLDAIGFYILGLV